MWPTLVEVQTGSGPVGIHTYGMFIVLAFSAAFALAHVRAQRIGWNPDRMIGAYVSAGVGGLLGGRLLYAVAVDWQQTLADPFSLLSCAGFALYGGIVGGALGVGLFAVLTHLSIWKLADIAGPAVVLGIGVGRMGCLFAGCCHGAVAPIGPHPNHLLPEAFTGGQVWLSSKFPFVTTEFHGGVGRLLDLPLYPTQLWSIAAGLSLAALLSWLWTKRRFDGQIAALTLMIEPPFRITIEAFRADQRGYVVSWPASEALVARLPPGMASAGTEVGAAVVGITTSQAIGLAMIALGAGIWFLRRNAGVGEEKPLQASEGDLLEELT